MQDGGNNATDDDGYLDQTAATQAAEESADWWNEQWLKFPTVSLDAEGMWHYWDVPDDLGIGINPAGGILLIGVFVSRLGPDGCLLCHRFDSYPLDAR